ncbi:MAG: HvfC/BufC family peptide modification chaperone [Gemmobacter sp.]
MMTPGFAAALLDPALAVPAGLTDAAGRPAGRRFAVYRNNVAVGLSEALVAGFPLLHRLVGDAFFRAMAGVFWRAHPPDSPVLADYGSVMPAFLAAFPPVSHLPYLPDVARLELALRAAYNAADAVPLSPARMATLPPDRLAGLRLTLAPALRLLRSDWPLFGIWAANMQGAPPPAMRPQDVVILRPAFDPAPHLLAQGGAAFIAALARGEPLGTAAAAAGPDHDLTPTLSLLVAEGAITGCEDTAP